MATGLDRWVVAESERGARCTQTISPRFVVTGDIHQWQGSTIWAEGECDQNATAVPTAEHRRCDRLSTSEDLRWEDRHDGGT
jgi:hypothetical protein